VDKSDYMINDIRRSITFYVYLFVCILNVHMNHINKSFYWNFRIVYLKSRNPNNSVVKAHQCFD
jgi:hypothetical protein